MNIEKIKNSYPTSCFEVQYLDQVCHKLYAVIGDIHGELDAVVLMNYITLHSLYFTDEFIVNDDDDLRKTIGYEMAAVVAAAMCVEPEYSASEWKDIRLNYDSMSNEYIERYDRLHQVFSDSEAISEIE